MFASPLPEALSITLNDNILGAGLAAGVSSIASAPKLVARDEDVRGDGKFV